ncbi:KilA-N domain-containing protein [Pseudomonas cichorii]|uniref:KilA-N domain-containing protein n=1 Tax=Pseudomonas cichorii TaxID=36746 RepID=UPI001C893F5A|nr:KilA-N domain-containing protein [Pseudomonas cichorii]MBX8528566.1 KilA-N domain-containing protein [Pseudomonas cichorii]
MNASNVIPFHYQGQAVRFNSEGWINATDAAKSFGKRVDHWLANSETQQYLEALSEALNTRNSGDLIRSQRGRAGGTWLHPKLAVAFARWLNVKFSVWADLHIDALLRGELDEKLQFDLACKALDDGKDIASLSGRELAKWKQKKPRLEYQVAYWCDQLQMTLGLDAA